MNTFTAHRQGIRNGFLAAMLIVGGIAAFISWDRQQETTRVHRQHIAKELELMGQVVEEAVMRRDLTRVETLLQQWGERNTEVAAIKAVSPNGFVMADYLRQPPAQAVVTHRQEVTYRGRPILHLEIRHDMEAAAAAGWRAAWRMGGLDLALTTLLGSILWWALRHGVVLPLEREVVSRREAEMALRRSQRDYEIIFETVRAMIWFVDRHHRVVRVNGNAARHAGITPAEATGKTVHDLFGLDFAETCHTDNETVMASGLPKLGIIAPGPYRDGATGWFQADKIPYRDENDQVAGLIIFVADITPRKRYEEAIVRLSRQNEAILHAVGEGIFGVDTEGRTTFVNPAALRMTGWKREELLGRRQHELLHHTRADGSPLPAEECPVYASFRDGQTHHQLADDVFWRKDGSRFPVEYVSTPLIEEECVRGTVVVFRDISERKRMEDDLLRSRRQAEEASRSKSRFLAAMSHDIRTPMSTMLGMAELLAEKAREDQRRHVETLLGAGAVLQTLIDDILDLSRIEAGQVELERRPFDPAAVVGGVLELLAAKAAHKGIALNRELHPGIPPRVHGDATRLGQVLLNLVGNAIKFTPDGEVRVTVTPGPDDTLLFAVRDTGVGIPVDKRELIFEPFAQADATVGRALGGIGLGLSICRHLVTLMGGVIGVESAEGQGSVFHFTLPLPSMTAEDPSASVLPPSASDGEAEDLRQERRWKDPLVLLAEDSADNRSLIEAFLDGFPCRLEMVENGAEAVNRLRHRRYDLVLMDVQMPVMDGYAATRAIRALEHERGLSPTPILALTAYAMREDRERSLAAGCNDHLVKPIRKRLLLDAITRWRHAHAS